MLLLAGPVNVDLIFAEPHVDEPPWQPDAANLSAIDAYVWDWIRWLHSKQSAHHLRLVAVGLRKMHTHMLEPMGISVAPRSIDEAIVEYRRARSTAERRFDRAVPRALEYAVHPAMSRTLPDHPECRSRLARLRPANRFPLPLRVPLVASRTAPPASRRHPPPSATLTT